MKGDWRSRVNGKEIEKMTVTSAELTGEQAEIPAPARMEALQKEAERAAQASDAATIETQEINKLTGSEDEEERAVTEQEKQKTALRAVEVAARVAEEVEKAAERDRQIGLITVAEAAEAAAISGAAQAGQSQTRQHIARLPARPRGWKISHLGVNTGDAMYQFDREIPRTVIEFRAVRRIAMLNACRCGKQSCSQCSSLGAHWISRVLIWSLTLGRHNRKFSMNADLHKTQQTGNLMKAIRHICRIRAYKISMCDREYTATGGHETGDYIVQIALKLLIGKLTSIRPAPRVCHPALILMVTCTFKWFEFDAIVKALTLHHLVFWIAQQILHEELNEEWLAAFFNNCYNILLHVTRDMLGELFSLIPAQTLHEKGYDRVIVDVLNLLYNMASNIFVRFRCWNLLQRPETSSTFRRRAKTFSQEVQKFLRLLRVHRDIQIRPNIALPHHWPCQRLDVFLTNISALPGRMHESSLGPLRQIATNMGVYARDAFDDLPRWTCRSTNCQWILNEVNFSLSVMDRYTSVDTACEDVERQGVYIFSRQIMKNYFRTAAGD